MLIKTAEVITIGDEIMIGQITDTNTQFISNELNKIGIEVVRKSSIGDSRERIMSMLDEAFERSDLILMTGGLGPTKDDITKHTISAYFGSSLVVHEPTLAWITAYFAKRGREVTETNRQQAMVPEICEVIENAHGSAPCMWIEKNGKFLVCMPGVPFEMRALMTGGVLSKIKNYLSTQEIYHKTILLSGIGESMLSDMIVDWELALPAHVRLAYLPSYGTIRLRLTALGSDYNQLKDDVSRLFAEVYPLIHSYIISERSDKIEEALGFLLQERRLTLCTAESCTGGGIAAAIVSVPGSSRYFKGGVVAYSNDIKMQLLGVNEKTLQEYGAVSEQCVQEMAINATRILGSDLAVAVSGIAGPDGGSDEKPVGTIWICCSDGSRTLSKKIIGTSAREANVALAINQSIFMIFKFLT